MISRKSIKINNKPIAFCLCPKFFFNEIEKGLDFYSNKYEKFKLIGDLNCEPVDSVIRDFIDSYDLNNIVKSRPVLSRMNPDALTSY